MMGIKVDVDFQKMVENEIRKVAPSK